ncbi:MAG: polysaccharide biosynthesis protein [Paenibacillaceae bacterium]
MEHRRGKTNTTGVLWVKGAAVLGAAAVISKLLGTLQKIPLQNIAGDEAYGIYTAVYPFYILILFLATAGFPIAVSTFVADNLVKGNILAARQVLKVAIILLTISGMIGFVVLFFGASIIAGWIGNAETIPAIQSVSFALLFVPIMAALRGYFQGSRDMVPTAVSQVVEQFIRVGTMIVVLILLTSWTISASWIAAGATFGAVTGAVAGLLVMLMYWRRHERLQELGWRTSQAASIQAKERFSSLARRMLLFAIPVCLGAIAVPLMSIVDTFTLPRLLHQPGMSDLDVMTEFGIYARGLPLVQMVAMLVSAISVALVPAIAEARSSNDWHTVRQRAELSIRLTWLVGVAASMGLAITALPVNIMLYENTKGTMAIAIVAFTAMFSTVNITTTSVLQGIGSVTIPAINLLIATMAKVLLNFLLVPVWGIYGAALAAVLAFAIATILNVIAIRRTVGVALPLNTYVIRIGMALALMSAILLIIVFGIPAAMTGFSAVSTSGRLFNTCIAGLAIITGMIVYMAALIRLEVLAPHELTYVPGAKSRLLPLLRRLRLISETTR